MVVFVHYIEARGGENESFPPRRLFMSSMLPFLRDAILPLRFRQAKHSQSQARPDLTAMQSQWQNPTDVLTVLMIIGGDVVQYALAQLCGSSRFITPVAFSFGWLAYSFSTVLSVVGSGSLTPEADTRVLCVNVNSRREREVKSFVLSRLYRDLVPVPRRTPPSGLTLSFYETTTAKPIGSRHPDWVFYLGICVILLQFCIACIPGNLTGDWSILAITVGATLLVQLGAALPQWRSELWCAEVNGPHSPVEVVCLTGGNGSSHVIVVKSIRCGYKLEDLATGRIAPSRFTTIFSFALAILWIGHLLTMRSLESDGWYLLAIGGLGMAQNVVSAGSRRAPKALGFHIEHKYTVHQDKVFDALKEAEKIEKRVGLALLDIFFPGGLRPHEEAWRLRTLEQYETGVHS